MDKPFTITRCQCIKHYPEPRGYDICDNEAVTTKMVTSKATQLQWIVMSCNEHAVMGK